MAQQDTRNVNQTLSYPRNATQARYEKDKAYTAYIQKVWPKQDAKKATLP